MLRTLAVLHQCPGHGLMDMDASLVRPQACLSLPQRLWVAADLRIGFVLPWGWDGAHATRSSAGSRARHLCSQYLPALLTSLGLGRAARRLQGPMSCQHLQTHRVRQAHPRLRGSDLSLLEHHPATGAGSRLGACSGGWRGGRAVIPGAYRVCCAPRPCSPGPGGAVPGMGWDEGCCMCHPPLGAIPNAQPCILGPVLLRRILPGAGAHHAGSVARSQPSPGGPEGGDTMLGPSRKRLKVSWGLFLCQDGAAGSICSCCLDPCICPHPT